MIIDHFLQTDKSLSDYSNELANCTSNSLSNFINSTIFFIIDQSDNSIIGENFQTVTDLELIILNFWYWWPETWPRPGSGWPVQPIIRLLKHLLLKSTSYLCNQCLLGVKQHRQFHQSTNVWYEHVCDTYRRGFGLSSWRCYTTSGELIDEIIDWLDES